MSKKDFLAHLLVVSIATIPAAFVKQCSKNADQVEFRQRYNSAGSNWGESSYSKSNYFDDNINWINPSDLFYPDKKNEIVINYEEDLTLSVADVPSSVKLISSIPDTSDKFNNVFSKNPSSADMDDAKSALEKLSETHIKAVHLSSKNSEDLLNGISNTDENIVVILGHNDNGFIKFGDGSELNISDISLECKNNEKHCVFISCKSKSFLDKENLGLDYNIIMSDAVLLVRELVKKIQRKESTSLKEIDSYLTSSISKVRFYNGSKVAIKV